MDRIRVVCFDLGGVVVRICRTWAEGCAAAGVPDRRSDRSLPYLTAFEGLHHRHQVGELGCAEYAEALSRHVDRLYSAEEIMRVHHAWLLGEYAGVAEIVDRLHAAGVETAILSNTNHAHWDRMASFETVSRIRHRFGSHELGLRKPDPAVYAEARRRLAVPASSILFFDDLPDNLAGARDAGWRSEMVDHSRETAPQIVDGLVRHGVV